MYVLITICCARECALLGGVMSQQIPTKKMGSLFDRHIADMGFWGNIQWTWLPSRRVVNLWSKNSSHREASHCLRRFKRQFSLHCQDDCFQNIFRSLSMLSIKGLRVIIVVLFYGHWLIFGCPGTLQELAAGIGIFCHCCFAVLQGGLVWYQYWSQLPSLRRSLWAQGWQ